MAFVVFGGLNINYILDEISIAVNQTFVTSPYIGGNGSDTKLISREARVLSFKSLCLKDEQSSHNRGHRINDYISAGKYNNNTPRVLVSESQSNINGNYICKKMEYTEDTLGNYIIDWEFQEVIKFNVTNTTFRIWGKAVTKKNTTSATAKKTVTQTATNKLDSNTKYLLKSCGTMKKGQNAKKCIKSLQKFLQSQGYYKGYKIDGIYGVYTQKAVKSLQKKYKQKVTGSWDKNTRAYFQKKYKYPTQTKVIDMGTIGNKNAVYSNNKVAKI